MTHSRAKGAVGERARQLLALTARPQGVSSTEVSLTFCVSIGNASAMLARQVNVGRVVVDKSAGKKCTIYRAVQPDMWAGHVPSPAPQVRPKAKPRRAGPKFHVVPEQAGQPAPVTIIARPNTKPSGTDLVLAQGAKVTRVPGWTHDPRYQVDPEAKVVGGFATMGIGRYLP